MRSVPKKMSIGVVLKDDLIDLYISNALIYYNS